MGLGLGLSLAWNLKEKIEADYFAGTVKSYRTESVFLAYSIDEMPSDDIHDNVFMSISNMLTNIKSAQLYREKWLTSRCHKCGYLFLSPIAKPRQSEILLFDLVTKFMSPRGRVTSIYSVSNLAFVSMNNGLGVLHEES